MLSAKPKSKGDFSATSPSSALLTTVRRSAQGERQKVAVTEMLAQIVFGWPAIITSLVLSAAGILFRRPFLVALGAVFFIAPALYLSGYPAIRWFGLLLPVCLFGAAYAVRKKKPVIAWLLTLPALVASVWLAYLVLTQ